VGVQLQFDPTLEDPQQDAKEVPEWMISEFLQAKSNIVTCL